MVPEICWGSFPKPPPLITTLVLTGLRWGEATALIWSDVENAETTSVLRILRSFVRGVIRNTTKRESVGSVPFPPELATVLRAHRHRLIEAQHPGPKQRLGLCKWREQAVPHDALFAKNRSAPKYAGVGKHVTHIRRTATGLLRRAAVELVNAKDIIGHATDCMREHTRL